MTPIQEDLIVILQGLKNIANIEASVIVSHQGLVIVSDVPDYVPEQKLSAFTATIMDSAKTVMEELRLNSPNMLIIRSNGANIILMEAGDEAILGTMFREAQNLGLVVVEMEDACRKISMMFD